MESLYTPVPLEDSEDRNKFYWKYVLRQTFISSAPWSLYFVAGLYFGTPTVMLPQIRKEANSTAAVSEEMASWISSITGYSSIPWIVILPILSEIYGRKLPFIISFIVSLIGGITWYLSTRIIFILIADMIISVLNTCCMAISPVIIGEYSSPKYRGILMTLKSDTFYWGVWVANIIGTFSHWRNIIILAIICTLYSATSLKWPESPYWLATQGRFDECAASHRYLMGTNEEAERELEQLITSQKNYVTYNSTPKAMFSRERFVKYFKIFSQKVVYKPMLLSLTILTMLQLSGKFACSMYAIEILKKMTGKESTAYRGMLILDAICIVGMYLGCYFSKILKRRIIFFSTSFCAIIFLYSLSLYLYLIRQGYFKGDDVISLILLTLYSISISSRPVILITAIFAELLPLRFKGTVIVIMIIINNIIFSTILKISPSIFKSFGLHGAFLVYGVGMSICTLILFKYLPETKDKTLVEIEEYFVK